MSLPLTAEEEAEYTKHIDQYLRTCDLDKVTKGEVRQALQDTLNKDLSSQKKAIKRLIETRFDALTEPAEPSPEPVKDEPNTDGHNSDNQASVSGEEDEVHHSEDATTPPPKKKVKRVESTRESSSEDADARLAAELQAQEEKLARGRTTRGGGKTKDKKMKSGQTKKTKAKSAKRVREDDGSGAESAAEKPKRGGGFQKPFNLSAPLAEVCGEPQLSRPQVVKKLWEHIKANNLQNPDDKREILCDDAFQAVFKVDSINMFKMNKHVGQHLYPVEEQKL